MPVSRRGFLLVALLTLFVACGGYLFFWPVGIDPESWTPPALRPWKSNDVLIGATVLQTALPGPEAVAIDGRLGRLVDETDDVGVDHAAGPDHAQHAQSLAPEGIDRGDEAALAHLLERILAPDHHLHAALRGHARQQVDELGLVLERAQERSHGPHVREIRLIQHVDGAAHVKRPVPQDGGDLLEDRAAPRPQGIERIGGGRHVVQDGAEGLPAIPAGQGATDLAQLLAGEPRPERNRSRL